MSIVDGKTLIGWGVVRERPWHFAGLFAFQTDAQSRATEMGEGYVVRYGERASDLDTFAWAVTPGYIAIAGSIFAPVPAAPDSRLAVAADCIDNRVAAAKEGY